MQNCLGIFSHFHGWGDWVMGSLSVASTFWINVTNDTNSTWVLFEISFQLNPLQGQFIVWKQQKHKYLIKQVRILSTLFIIGPKSNHCLVLSVTESDCPSSFLILTKLWFKVLKASGPLCLWQYFNLNFYKDRGYQIHWSVPQGYLLYWRALLALDNVLVSHETHPIL